MVFIVADIFSTTPHAEDHSNVLAALAIQMLFPTVQFRLMAVSESLPPPSEPQPQALLHARKP